jgi:cell division initiation protein
MSLSINDIQDKQFHVRFRGFDIEEVDEFLELVVENFSILVEDNKSLTSKVKTLSDEFDRVKNQESSFRNAIVSAQNIADEMVKKSRKDADDLIAEAHEEIKVLKDEAHREVGELEGRVDKLSVMQDALQEELRAVLISYQQKLDDIPATEINGDAEKNSPETPQEVKRSPLSEVEPDLSDLYETIDIGDDLNSEGSLLGYSDEQDFDHDEENQDDLQKEANTPDENIAGIPDLDGEVMFTLHDPLDDEDSEVNVAIDGEKN